MSPITIDGCFGWAHIPSEHGSTDMSSLGVVLCPGLLVDELTGYRSFHLLAELLAGVGFPTLRLHYSGTGDSRDPEPSVECWQQWQRDIQGAIDWLRENCGISKVVLCGFRLGGLLAATVAASRSDVVGLSLIAPVIRGRSYIRQIIAESAQAVKAIGCAIDAGRFILSRETLSLMSQAELRTLSLNPTCRVATFAQPSAAMAACASVWQKSGVDVTGHDLSGLEPMLRPTFAMHEAAAEFSPVLSWILRLRADRIAASYRQPEPAAMTARDWVETPQVFGAESKRLFGVLCQPRTKVGDVAVIMLNPSGDPHCASMTVNIARYLAAAGIASLRMDFAGLGDSSAAEASHVFESDRTKDGSAAIDLLRGLGYQKLAVYGLCSGAYHAFHCAMADRRIEFALLINLPFFKWTPGFPVENLTFDVRNPGYFIQRIGTKAFWSTLAYKLSHHELDIRVRFAWLERKLRRLPGFTHDASDAVTLSKRVKMLFLVSEGDISLEILRREFGVRPPRGTTIRRVPELNHAMTGGAMRETVAQLIISFLADANRGKMPSAASLRVATAA